MKLPDIIPYTRYIVLAVALLVGGSMLRACYLAGRVKQQLELAPPFPKREVKAIKAKSTADSVKAVVYKRVAVVAIKQADSARTVARKAVTEADSLRSQYEAILPVADSPFSAVEQRLSTYTSPDTSGF